METEVDNIRLEMLNVVNAEPEIKQIHLQWLYVNPGPAFANSVDPDQLASEETN